MKKQKMEFRTILALVLAITIILLPFNTLALTGQAVTSENTAVSEYAATPDEARPDETEPDEQEPTRHEKDDDLAKTGANILDGEGTEESPYIIASSDDWDALSESINIGSTEYSGGYFLLTDDISVSTVLGNRPDSSTDSNDNYFSGTFDGDGHELNVNINESGFGAAPFAIAHNATIKNLHVTGTVKSGANHATGLVAASKGRSIYDASYLTIQNVTVSTDISCPSHVAGIVGHAHNADITMENVVFDGSMSASSVQGGMIGWGGLGNGATYSSSFKDCLFAGTYNTNAAFYPVAFANGQGTATLINDFYTTTFGGGGNPIAPTGAGQLKLLAAQVEKDGSVQYFDNINTAADSSNWVEGSTLKLMTDVTTSSTITVPSGEHTLDLNGHGIKMTGSGSVISVGSGAVLDLTDSDQTRTHKFDVPDGAGLATLNETSGNYTVSGGYITGGNANPYGGGVRVAIDGKFNMYGGTIIGNTATSHGGGVSVSGTGQSASSVDNFKMYGGAISYNTANWGGGIGIYGNVYIYDTSIISNNTANSGGGGIELEKNGRLYMCGGNVTENKLTAMNGNMWKGGGIHVPSGAQFHFSGSPHIKDNYQSDGTTRNNVFVRSGGPIITVDDTVEKDASVGVTLQVNTGVVTSGWNDKMGEADPSKFFTSDNPDYEVFSNNNGEAEIGIVPHEHDDLSFTKWSDTTALPPTAGNYCLSADVTISSRWDVPAGTTNLCLNGHSITRTNASSNTGMVINVGSGAVLNLYDCDDETTHYYTVDDPSPNGAGLGKVVDESAYNAASENARGTFKGGYITGGSITGENNGTSHLVGGGVNVDSGSFTLNGGTIIGNSVTWNGGGVKVRGKNASFTMNGGAILANWNRYYGGGISVGDNNAGNVCKLKINGGTIRHNWSGRNGGAIHLDGKAHTVLINGGNIIDNYTDGNLESTGRSGGGILTDVTSVQLSGTPVIKGNAIKSGVSNDVSVRANGSDRLDLSGHLEQGADVGIYVPGWTSNANADYMVATGAEQSDIRYVHYDVPSEGLLLFCDGSKDWICLDGALVELSGGHHTHQAGTVWVSSLPVAAVTAGETTTLYGSLDAAVSAWTAGSTLKLLTDVTTSSTITVPTGEHTLDLNGHGIKMTGSGSVFNVGSGAALDLTDSNQTIPHKFDVPDGAGLATLNETSGNYTVNGGYITGGNSNQGGGVYVKGGTFTLTGGTIIGNQAQREGGGVFYESNSFSMNGGAIIYNKSQTHWGGGINVGGPFNMSDGVVSHNYAGDGAGGAHCHYLVMTGGSITDNYAAGSYAGGVNVNNNATLSGNITITDNTNNTGKSNLYCKSVIIADTLSDTSSIGIKTQSGTGTFTTGWKDNMGEADPSKYFTSDDNNYQVFLNGNGEAEIGTPPVASVINGDTTMNYGSLSDAVIAWTVGSTLKLLADVTTDGTITVPSGEHTLDLNGYGILMTGNDRVVTINQGASLELNDSDPDRIHYITLTNYRGTAVSDSGEASVSNGNGVIKVTGGYLTGGYRNNSGSHDRCGAGVYNWGTFVMNGGSIVGNTLYNNSGGAIRNSGYFTMNGGTIAFNYASGNGGGVTTYVPGGSQGKMTMNGGEISDNYCGSYGGGIQIAGPIEMTGGSVVRNTAGAGGSGVFYDGKNDRFKLSGNPVIKDNSKNDDLYLGANATFMINGSLTEEADIHVLMNTPAEFTVGWKNIMGNADPAKYFTSTDSSYSVFLNNNGEAEIGVPPVASVINGDTTTNYGSLSDAVNAWTAGSTLKLLTDVTTSGTITVPSGEHTLDLNGHGITRTGATGNDNTGLVITMGDGVNLTVTGPGKITGGRGFHGGGIHVEGNSSLVLDNCEISGNTGHYGGGLYLKNGTITLKNGTVVKNNSATEGFGGSGIYAEGGGTLILEGGTFTDNEIRNSNQYAVFLAGNANAQVSGAPVIYDNKYGDTQKNLYMFQASGQQSIVRIAGALTDGAKIGVGQTTGAGIITSGWKDIMGDADPSTYFTSDNDSYVVAMSGGEATVKYPDLTDVTADGYEGGYDGEAHGITVTAPDGVTIKYGTKEGSYTLTDNPTYTDAGTYTVYYEASIEKYSSVYGSAVVQIDPIDVTVTITGHNSTVDYDSEPHIVTGYDAVASSTLYDVDSSIKLSGPASASRVDAGTTEMGLAADKFENTNSNFANVTFNVTDGYITIDPIDVTVTVTGNTGTFDYDGTSHRVTGYVAVADTELYDVTKDFNFIGLAKAERTDVGTMVMGLEEARFENRNSNFENVVFLVTDGYLTVEPVDAVITTAPHAKSELIYNGSDQELIAAGAADGGTLYYALGDDAKTAPADESYATAIPTATQIGNYYIWYMVKGDSNHNDLSPTCVKVTMADQGWGTVSGGIADKNNNPVKNATVTLTAGGRVIDEIISGSDGSYYFTVPAGIYDIVVRSDEATVTEMVNVSDRTTYDLTVPDSDTDSVLDIVDTDSRIVVGGLAKEAAAVRDTQGVPADQNVSVRMTVKTVAESDTIGSQAISGIAGDMFVEYYDCKVEKTVNTVTTSMDKTQTVLELVIPCSYTNKRELTVYNSDGSGTQTLTLSDSKASGTYRVDQNAGLVYIYTDRIATYAVGYKPYYSVKSDMTLGSYTGDVSVTLTKDGTGETYELNNVSLQNISFSGIPKGTYSMTVTWTDGAENTITTPFIIN